MSVGKMDTRQWRNRSSLDRITGSADSTGEHIFNGLNSEVTPPLALQASSPTSLVLQIGNITKTNPETSANKTISPISDTLPTFTSGTITLGSTGAGSATPSVGSALSLGMSASQFLKIGISIDSAGSLTLTKGTAGASLGAATAPLTVSGSLAIGYFVARTNGSNNVQNILNSDIYQYIGGTPAVASTGGYAKTFVSL